jgi:hypothetical protein
VEVHYREHVFGFERLPDESFVGRMLFESGERELLAELIAAEEECWYLDEGGERLPADRLFARSPWSCPGPSGPVKLLCRFLDLRDGSARFDTPATYPDELFRWLRAESGARSRKRDVQDP